MKSFYYITLVSFLTVSSSIGCSASKLLLGDVDPVDEKSETMQIIPIETWNSEWKRIGVSGSNGSTGSPDRAWQSIKTASVISINSACRQGNDDDGAQNETDLKEISADLLNQWQSLENKTERDLVFSGFPAFETTAEGIYFNRKRKFQTLVVKTPTCLYDLIFLSPPKFYAQDIATFQKFRDKLILK